MTESQKSKIIKLRAAGNGCKAIANKLGMSVNTVKSFCKRNNIDAETAARLTETHTQFSLTCFFLYYLLVLILRFDTNILLTRGKTASISTEKCRSPIETFRYSGYSAFLEASPILSSYHFRPALTIRFKNAGRGRSADDDRAPEVKNNEITGHRIWVWEDCPAAWHIGEHGEVVLPQAEPQ